LFNNWARHERGLEVTAQQVTAELDTTWSELLRELGLEPRARDSDGSLSNDDVLAVLREAASDPDIDIDGNLSMGKFNGLAERNEVPVAATTIVGRFGFLERRQAACRPGRPSAPHAAAQP
jgi:hypothetical protein